MKIGEMLNLLDGYPCELRCRYANKVACFTKVFLISNISLNEQYTDIQRSQSETWNAFCAEFIMCKYSRKIECMRERVANT